MKKIIYRISFLVFTLLITSHVSYSQELHLYSQYLLNSYLVNPAVAGAHQYASVVFTDRHQWMGIADAPNMQSLSVQGRVRNVGLGAHIYNYDRGFNNTKGFQVSYAFHLLLKKYAIAFTQKQYKRMQFSYRSRRKTKSDKYLSLGVSFTGFIHSFDYSPIRFNNPNDPLFAQGSKLGYSSYGEGTIAGQEYTFYPDANFGIFYYSRKVFVGFTAAQLLQPSVNNMGRDMPGNKIPRTYFFSGGYSFEFKDVYRRVWLEVEPSLAFKMTENLAERQIDANVRAYYLEDFWIGASYRYYLDDLPGTPSALLAYVGLPLFKNVNFAYGYEFAMSDLSQYSNGTHEFRLEIIFHRVRKNKFCPRSRR